jgi:hypothetical protein
MLVIPWGRDDDGINNDVGDGVLRSLWRGNMWRELRMQVLHWGSLHASRIARCVDRFELHAGSKGVGLS